MGHSSTRQLLLQLTVLSVLQLIVGLSAEGGCDRRTWHQPVLWRLQHTLRTISTASTAEPSYAIGKFCNIHGKCTAYQDAPLCPLPHVSLFYPP
jgi:hypothetical protein